METMEIRGKVIGCLEELGIFADTSENFLLNEYVQDSMTYMMFLVNLEQAFGVAIPDEHLSSIIGPEQTLEDICTLIETLLGT
ncbi:MAG: acyl carrier protein [Treponema sp.]|jgi:acyl carrier protein|nr:acyl carrier protein [Treponema sp.]